MPQVVYVSPSSEQHGGIRVIFEHAEGLVRRGYEVLVVGPDPAPDWHDFDVEYRQRPIYEPGGVPAADIAIGTFYTTMRPAFDSGSGQVFHLCQGYEGVHREYAPILHEIDSAYQLPVPKLLISAHLEPILQQRYGCTCYVLSQALDSELFSPGRDSFRRDPEVLRVAVVGSFGFRSKGIHEALEGLRRARDVGHPLEVHRASSLPCSDEERALRVTDVFHHQLSTKEMVDFYRGVDALLYSSHDEEGFPLPPIEAMACGVPVALTDISPFAALPRDAVLRYPPGTPAAVPDLIARLRDPMTRARLHVAGLEAARKLTPDAQLDRIEAAFAAEGVATGGVAVSAS
ncbi:MAG: glycosyltransferase family 4 protein [Thermoanaerobaculia bacterium]|nr:glycosyltransferase family 4 protein [Thermoanaerobaculia bacterium]